MKVLLDINTSHEETSVTIHCQELDDSIKDLLDLLQNHKTEFIVGSKGDVQHILNPKDIHSFYSEDDAVMAVTSKGTLRSKKNYTSLKRDYPPIALSAYPNLLLPTSMS